MADSQYYSEDFEGDGLRNIVNGAIDRVQGFFKGVRLDFPPKERELLRVYGSTDIVQMTLCRAPIHSMLDKTLNVLSFGQWESLKSQHNFDKLFHLYMVLRLSNNRMIRLEKNEVIKIANSFKIESDAEFLDVPLHNQKITLQELLENTIRAVGKKQVFIYSPWSNNCQRFLMDILQSNNLLTDKERQFIYQDITELVKKLPWVTKYIGQKTTDLAHTADILIHGQGF